MGLKEIVYTEKAPKAIGPYSQAVKSDDMVYLSGQIAIDSTTQQFIGGDIDVQTKQVLKNISAVLNAAGSSLEGVVKTTIYLIDMDDFAYVNEIYDSYFSSFKPAHSTVCVSKLPMDAKIEIDAIAIVK